VDGSFLERYSKLLTAIVYCNNYFKKKLQNSSHEYTLYTENPSRDRRFEKVSIDLGSGLRHLAYVSGGNHELYNHGGFNIPSAERVALLESLQVSIGDVPPHFWAACQICDLDALRTLVKCGREYPNILSGITSQNYPMAHYCT
jgi:hypothetical protein